ncbi:MAG: flagellar biosynthesis anti-sigma factor FlgM [Myxococcales bacterium]
MKVNEPKSAAAAHPSGVAPTGPAPEASAALALGLASSSPSAAERVSTDEAAHLNDIVASATKMAASERALRLQALTQQVRSGNYHPNVSQLADQILAQAELDARLAKNLH